jgi:Glutathione S-transferase
MLKLHGSSFSNYYNMLRHALLEKGLPFEEVERRPSQDPEFLARSPMGKVPVLETEEGFLTETTAIFEYLDERHPERPLFPRELFARARVRQLIKTHELYVESPAHMLILAVFGRQLPAHVLEHSQVATKRGLAAVARLARFSPWAIGSEFTFADIFMFHSCAMSNHLTKLVYQWDLLQEVPGLAEWYARVAEREHAHKILQQFDAAMAAISAKQGAKAEAAGGANK